MLGGDGRGTSCRKRTWRLVAGGRERGPALIVGVFVGQLGEKDWTADLEDSLLCHSPGCYVAYTQHLFKRVSADKLVSSTSSSKNLAMAEFRPTSY